MSSRFLAAAFLAASLAPGLSAAPASAAPLISFDDGSDTTAGIWSFGPTRFYFAVSWTQSAAASNVQLSAPLVRFDDTGSPTASWWLTNQIGAGTTAANVVASGSYTPTTPFANDYFDLNGFPYTTIFTGIDLPAGTYYVVLNGPTTARNTINTAAWYGDTEGYTINAAPGFSPSGIFSAASFSGPLDPFAPAAAFGQESPTFYAFFRLDGDLQSEPVSEPATLALLGAGLFGLASLRRRKA